MIAATVAKAAAEKATAGAKRIYVCGGVLIVDLLASLTNPFADYRFNMRK